MLGYDRLLKIRNAKFEIRNELCNTKIYTKNTSGKNGIKQNTKNTDNDNENENENENDINI